ncbi:hypothetical protein BCR32DRAFT_283033 [Anaeromyces robustus]|uniref:AAA-ATPase-like domain-containing protein n=1 Tax=Anaeromyces robustus TaxID=1754192 RepID=A0A1Y1WVY0_9FUNG|nr:hypothetical protein BCR32DRAFT_283033 [Anaeromyces robustus]|eukprot:ORX77622.1 hypothetical protein BCR32DRAFT_283033 [Anaeromyces robustus]
MGFIIDNKKMYGKFKGLLNQDFFVDKSNIINDFNKLIDKDGRKNVCITKPRRFGKTSIAAMLTTYYSKGIDSQEIFDKLKVSKGKSSDETEKKKKEIKQYREFQGKYHTLYFDFSSKLYKYNSLEDLLNDFNNKLKKDIKNINKEFNLFKYKNDIIDNYENDIIDNLEYINDKTGESFIIIIDEWDYIIFSNKFTPDEKVQYLGFLKSLIKDQGYSSFAYMTGISPIAKELSQSTLNCFDEYSMLNDKKYYQYFGFTEQEVRDLYLENWYNGYKAYNGEKIFNPWSVCHALENDKIKNYWNDTGRFDELVNIINFNILGVKDDILELIKGKKIKIELENFGAENILDEIINDKETSKNDMKTELYSKMVTFGFLTYYDGNISIPNKELEEKFLNVLNRNDDLKYYYNMINNSENMLNMTLNNNPEEICKILEQSHMAIIRPGDKMDHGNLKRVIEFAYFNARIHYIVNEEVSEGKGISDFIFYPKNKRQKVIIIELKVNGSAKEAIKQIHQKKYYNDLKNRGYTGNILLVGINLNKKQKSYSCKIEEYDNELKILISNKEYLPNSENKKELISDNEYSPNSKNKRKHDQESESESESDGVYKRLRSATKRKKKN